LVALARRVAARVSDAIAPLENLLLPTDALPVAVAGFPVLTLLAAGDDGGIPHYHWHTDVLENAERAVVELTEAFAWALLQALGRRVSRGGEQGGSLSGWNCSILGQGAGRRRWGGDERGSAVRAHGARGFGPAAPGRPGWLRTLVADDGGGHGRRTHRAPRGAFDLSGVRGIRRGHLRSAAGP